MPQFRRPRALGTSQTPFAAWLVSFVVALATDAILASRFVVLDMTAVEANIESGIDQQVSGPSASVSCPSDTLYQVHELFLCTATSSSDSGVAVLTRTGP